MSRRKAPHKIPKNTVENRKRGLFVNVLGRPRKNNWGTRFGWNVHLDVSKGGSIPITGSFAARINAAKTGDAMRGFALINGTATKITVYIYY